MMRGMRLDVHALGIGSSADSAVIRAVAVVAEQTGFATLDEIASYTGAFATFENIRVNPKPREGAVPVLCGGNSDGALRRVTQWGDGWYGFNLLDIEDVAVKMTTLHGRNPAELREAVALRQPDPSTARHLGESDVDELVLVASAPQDPARASAWVAELAAGWQ